MVSGFRKSQNSCCDSVVKLHEMFVMVDYVQEMTVKNSCMAKMDCLRIFSSCNTLY